jgi:hypothetical protein
MLDRLPYTLTTGVTATREGLAFVDGTDLADLLFGTVKVKVDIHDESWLWRWEYVAERLRYRDGEPWCAAEVKGLYCGSRPILHHGYPEALHRLAVILCDNAEAFRVLHWCIHNLGGEQ